MTTESTQPTTQAERIDHMATTLLKAVDEMCPRATDPDELGAQALVAALMRRLGPYGYSRFTEWMPASRAA